MIISKGTTSRALALVSLISKQTLLLASPAKSTESS